MLNIELYIVFRCKNSVQHVQQGPKSYFFVQKAGGCRVEMFYLLLWK